MNREFNLVLDQEVLERYEKYYFSKYPRRKKRPIDRPIHESINKWMIMQRLQMNDLKQKWKEFIVWWVDSLGLGGVRLETFEMEFDMYFPTQRRSDPDNYVPKFILDGFTEAGLIADDDGKHLKRLSLSTHYEKNNPKTVIHIKEIR